MDAHWQQATMAKIMDLGNDKTRHMLSEKAVQPAGLGTGPHPMCHRPEVPVPAVLGLGPLSVSVGETAAECEQADVLGLGSWHHRCSLHSSQRSLVVHGVFVTSELDGEAGFPNQGHNRSCGSR